MDAITCAIYNNNVITPTLQGLVDATTSATNSPGTADINISATCTKNVPTPTLQGLTDATTSATNSPGTADINSTYLLHVPRTYQQHLRYKDL